MPIAQVLPSVLLLVLSPGLAVAVEYSSALPTTAEASFLKKVESWEAAKTDRSDAVSGQQWRLRSDHFVFGMPRVVDDRHDFTPPGFGDPQPGITVLVREGFVVGHFDRMKAPLWVAQRWTKYDQARMVSVAGLNRYWREDPELPLYAHGGKTYNGNQTVLDRGHMARHAMNRGWGEDNSHWGCKMSNSAPQQKYINRMSSTWRTLEDEVADIVHDTEAGIEVIWTISGAIYRENDNPAGETPEQDFANVVRLTSGDFGVPDATYKVVGWFDENHYFQARAYVFEQPHTAAIVNGQQKFTYSLGDTKLPLEEYQVTVDELEERLGVDFFPMLADNIEEVIEATDYEDVWGAE